MAWHHSMTAVSLILALHANLMLLYHSGCTFPWLRSQAAGANAHVFLLEATLHFLLHLHTHAGVAPVAMKPGSRSSRRGGTWMLLPTTRVLTPDLALGMLESNAHNVYLHSRRCRTCGQEARQQKQPAWRHLDAAAHHTRSHARSCLGYAGIQCT